MSMSLNKVMLIGNVTADPEVKDLSGKSVCNFSVATSRSWTDKDGEKQEQTEFSSIDTWGKLADICGEYLLKGTKVYVEGRLQTRSWETDSGEKRYKTSVVADQVIILSKKNDNKGNSHDLSEDIPF